MSVVVLWLAGFFFILSLIVSIMQPHIISWLSSAVIAILFVWVLLPKYQAEQHALKMGQVVDSTVVDVRHWTRKHDSGDIHQYEIISQWSHPRTGQVYTFISQPLKQDPSAKLTETVRVKVDLDNPKAYIMDLSFLGQ